MLLNIETAMRYLIFRRRLGYSFDEWTKYWPLCMAYWPLCMASWLQQSLWALDLGTYFS